MAGVTVSSLLLLLTAGVYSQFNFHYFPDDQYDLSYDYTRRPPTKYSVTHAKEFIDKEYTTARTNVRKTPWYLSMGNEVYKERTAKPKDLFNFPIYDSNYEDVDQQKPLPKRRGSPNADSSRRQTTVGNQAVKEYTTPRSKRKHPPREVVHYQLDSFTTNPFTRPGVRPIINEDRPPITNKPKPTFMVNPRPTEAGAIAFPDDSSDSPDIIAGKDIEYLSEAQKRRYEDTAEKMCQKYKSLSTTQVAAIPLVPAPEPVSVDVPSCASSVPLVIGGVVVSIDQFPHMALLGWNKIQGGGYSWKCGGSLVSARFVLTAAHCSYQERDVDVVIGPPRAVQLGSSRLDDPGALVVRVSTVIRHPKYKAPRSYYDIALLKLVIDVTFSKVIKPACLGAAPPVGDPVIATGWGRTEYGGAQSLELRSVSLPVWRAADCSVSLGASRKLPQGVDDASQVCAAEPQGGKDTCQGDSGGPIQVHEECAWRVVGVTSLGRACGARNTPGVYAKVDITFVAANVFGDGRSYQTREVGTATADRNQVVHNSRSHGVGDRESETDQFRFRAREREDVHPAW